MSNNRFLIACVVAVLMLVPMSLMTPEVEGFTLGPDRRLGLVHASFWGEDSSDYTGYSVSGVGDVNGDGYDDIIIGAPYDEDGGSSAGQTYWILGKASGWAIDTVL